MRVRNMVIAGLAGAAIAYLLDPISGSARRNRLRERISTRIPRRATTEGELGPLPENMVPSQAARIADRPEEGPMTDVADAADEGSRDTSEPMDDATIARRIRMKVDERPDLETGSLVIDVVRGVAYLRGKLNDRRKLDEIVDLTSAVPGVRRVQSLLHLPESQTIERPATRPLGDSWNG